MPIQLQVGFKNGDESQAYIALDASAYSDALTYRTSFDVQMNFSMKDDELASEDLLNGLRLLHHLKDNNHTLLQQSRDELDGTDGQP